MQRLTEKGPEYHVHLRTLFLFAAGSDVRRFLATLFGLFENGSKTPKRPALFRAYDSVLSVRWLYFVTGNGLRPCKITG